MPDSDFKKDNDMVLFPCVFFAWSDKMVLQPTSTPFKSVMALNFPGIPSNGNPMSLALRFCAYVNELIRRYKH
jgi:hypothetical protein